MSSSFGIDLLRSWSFPGGKESTCQPRRCRFHLWDSKMLEKEIATIPVFYLGNPTGREPSGLQSVGAKEQHDLATKPPSLLSETEINKQLKPFSGLQTAKKLS